MIRTAFFAAAAFVALTASANAQAVSNTGTINLTGTVNLNCVVQVSSTNTSLDLVGGETSVVVGNVVETCNSGTGYRVSVSSANNGALVSSATNSGRLNYTVDYDGQTSSARGALEVSRSTARFDVQVPVTVTIPGNAQAIAGAYADTLTVTIAAQ